MFSSRFPKWRHSVQTWLPALCLIYITKQWWRETIRWRNNNKHLRPAPDVARTGPPWGPLQSEAAQLFKWQSQDAISWVALAKQSSQPDVLLNVILISSNMSFCLPLLSISGSEGKRPTHSSYQRSRPVQISIWNANLLPLQNWSEAEIRREVSAQKFSR